MGARIAAHSHMFVVRMQRESPIKKTKIYIHAACFSLTVNSKSFIYVGDASLGNTT